MGLPPRPFLYTIDQLSTVLSISVPALRRTYLFFENRSTGIRPPDRMLARNIAPADEKPEWRVAEGELIRWMRAKGFRYHERGWIEL